MNKDNKKRFKYMFIIWILILAIGLVRKTLQNDTFYTIKIGELILNNGIDLDKFRYNKALRDRIRIENGWHDKLLIGHVGRFSYQKNHNYLIRTFKAVKKYRHDAMLLLVGEGEREQDIKNLAISLGVIDDIIFFGTIPNVNELMQAMDVFVLPSHFEGLPIVGVEAQAAGLPSIFATTISRKAQIANNVVFLDLNEDYDYWARSIIVASEVEREDTFDIMEKLGFGKKKLVTSFLNIYHKYDRNSDTQIV